jgi:hypothetical protein
MLNFLALASVPILFAADYLAVLYWLLATTPQIDRPIQFSMRTLLVASTIIAIHCGLFAAFLAAT